MGEEQTMLVGQDAERVVGQGCSQRLQLMGGWVYSNQAPAALASLGIVIAAGARHPCDILIGLEQLLTRFHLGEHRTTRAGATGQRLVVTADEVTPIGRKAHTRDASAVGDVAKRVEAFAGSVHDGRSSVFCVLRNHHHGRVAAVGLGQILYNNFVVAGEQVEVSAVGLLPVNEQLIVFQVLHGDGCLGIAECLDVGLQEVECLLIATFGQHAIGGLRCMSRQVKLQRRVEQRCRLIALGIEIHRVEHHGHVYLVRSGIAERGYLYIGCQHRNRQQQSG